MSDDDVLSDFGRLDEVEGKESEMGRKRKWKTMTGRAKGKARCKHVKAVKVQRTGAGTDLAKLDKLPA